MKKFCFKVVSAMCFIVAFPILLLVGALWLDSVTREPFKGDWGCIEEVKSTSEYCQGFSGAPDACRSSMVKCFPPQE